MEQVEGTYGRSVIQSAQDTIASLEARIILAEKVMRNAWALSIIPNGNEVVAPMEEYRRLYPIAYIEHLRLKEIRA